jgi:uncharacterized protein YyaL (SSP411 family)
METLFHSFSPYFFTVFFLTACALAGSSGADVPARLPLPTEEEIAELPADGGPEFNRLIHETSPYLRQHARNPVDWYPWGEEAFAKAAKEDKPIFLSVGYSSCHWCHVMEHESFEVQKVADRINAFFIPVKVDREERPDVDEIYMAATQLMTQRGGWPNSVFLTPDKRPWYAGTYFPQATFMRLLNDLNDAWKTKRDTIEEQANRLTSAIQENSLAASKPGASTQLSQEILHKAVNQLQEQFDSRNGGFGGAPKFPPHSSLRLLLQLQTLGPDERSKGMITLTLDQMAAGGLQDHVGGGFHRYATDAIWFLPHFEKMLYDNGQLAWVYAEAFRQTKDPYYASVLRLLLDWVLDDMRDEHGGFYSAYDADSEGEEGKFYLWTHSELADLLGPEHGKALAARFQATEKGNYYEEATREFTGGNILHLRSRPTPEAPLPEWTAEALQTLNTERDKRVFPELDDKVLTSWNGLMISGLAHGAQVLEEARYAEAAEQAATFILTSMRDGERLFRTYRKGRAKLMAYLDDYAFLADGLIDLYEATNKPEWLDEARGLLEQLEHHFNAGDGGGYYFTANDHENLLTRSRDPFDRAIPAGNAVAARAWIRYAAHRQDPKAFDRGEKILEASAFLMERAPRAAATMAEVLHLYLQAKKEIFTTTEDATALATGKASHVKMKILKGPDTTSYRLVLDIDDQWHINAHEPGMQDLVGTDILPEEKYADCVFVDNYPEGESFTVAGLSESIQVFSGTVEIPLRVECTGPSVALQIRIQACDDKRCLPPETIRLEFPLETDTAGE